MASVAEALPTTERAGRRGRRWIDLAVRVPLVLVTLCLLGTLTFLLTGGRALIVRSGSMEPVIHTGDVAITRTISANDAAVGDIVTFKDPSRNGELVTHRVVKMHDQKDRIAFVTKGDANGGVERWKIESDGKIGRVSFNIPRAGYALVWIAAPKVRAILVGAAALLFAFAAIRRIWAT